MEAGRTFKESVYPTSIAIYLIGQPFTLTFSPLENVVFTCTNLHTTFTFWGQEAEVSDENPHTNLQSPHS